jgi:murein DD-endopeptidase MepM/ murein hydrolase activator NlpD
MSGFARFKTFTIICTFLITLPISLISGKYPKWDYRFPLDIPAVISGSFGELRGGHFHSGVDFATQGKTGFPMFSIDHGYVSRISVSPVGFGKAVYINHPNGYTSVYAHCEWFSDKIEEVATNLQYEKESFAINEYFEAGEIPVRRGEIIAYSGNSGSSRGAHLHFEIRETTDQRPVNVHFFNLPVKDDVPPHIEAICIYPLDEHSLVNGKNEPLYLPAVFHSGRFHLRGNPSITASGTIGVGIEAIDYFTGSWRKCGVYSIQLDVDQQQWFRSQMDGFLFSQTRYLNSHIDFARRLKHNQVIQKSFLDINNQLDIYTTTPERGRVKMVPGASKQFQYQVKDAAGNRSELSFTIQGTEPLRLAALANTPKTEKINPKKAWSTSISNFKVHFLENSFYTEIPANFELLPNNGTGIGKHFKVLDESIPVHQFFEITIPIPSEHLNNKNITGARIGANGRLIYTEGTRKGNNMVLRTRDAGIYCLTIDKTPPVLRLKSIPQNRNYSNRESIRLEMQDDFSGIASYRATINGEWMLFDYDPKNNELTGFFRNLRISKGSKHTLEVTAIDNSGNETSLKTDFTY